MINGRDPSIKPLDLDLQSFVHAYQSISTFHSAIEEIISNSIDANSTEINIYIDLDKFSFEVHDNGVGIVYENLISIGGWNQSSKHVHDRKTYGCKGEALSALKHICQHLDIYTVPYGLKDIYHKKLSLDLSSQSNDGFNQENNIQILRNDNDQINLFNHEHGTVVKVVGLFHNLPVRRNSIKADIEINHIKEYVQRIGVLHHHIAWSIYVIQQQQRGNDYCTYVRSLYLPIENSVLHRLFSIHTNVAMTLYNLEKVDCVYNGFTVTGLLSPPLSSCCHWNKEYQYGYINQRWLRNMDIMSSYINQCYNFILDSVVGMSSRSFTTMEDASYSPASSRISSRIQAASKATTFNNHRFPCFVLQVTCDTKEYDVLVEPDKSTIIFRNEIKLIRCLYNLMLNLFEKHLTKHDISRFIDEEAKYINRLGFIMSSSSSNSSIPSNTKSTHRVANQMGEDSYIPLSCVDTVINMEVNSNRNLYFNEFSCQQTALAVVVPSADHSLAPSSQLLLPVPSTQHTTYMLQDEMYTIQHNNNNNSGGGCSNNNCSNEIPSLEFSPTQSHLFSKAFFIHTPSSVPIMIPSTTTIGVVHQYSNNSIFSASQQWRQQRRGYFKDSPYSPHTEDVSSVERITHNNTTAADTPATQNSLNNMIVDIIERRNNENQFQELKRPRSVLNEFDDEVILKDTEAHPVVVSAAYESEVSVHVKKLPRTTDTTTSTVVVGSNKTFIPYDTFSDDDSDHKQATTYIQSQDIIYTTSPLYELSVTTQQENNNIHDNKNSNNDDDDVPEIWTSTNTTNVTYPLNNEIDLTIEQHPTTTTSSTEAYFVNSFNNDFISNNSLSPSCKVAKKNTIQSNKNSFNDKLLSICNTNQDSRSLNKEYLSDNLRLVGQADLRYILTHCCNAIDDDVILAFDQHAVDERIRYECYHNHLTKILSLSLSKEDNRFENESYTIDDLEKDDEIVFKVVLVSYSMELNYKEYSIIHTRANVLSTWMISYETYKSNLPDSQAEKFTLIVHKVPEIFGIRLLPADIREFLHYLLCNHELPDRLLKPPVLIRILASKSCRGAIKFGEMLTYSQLEIMLKKLLNCDFPFQCAHGRPSMIPIVDLKPLYASKIIELQYNSYSLL